MISKIKNQKSKIKNGFTLVELIIVMSVMGILMAIATVALPSLRQRATLHAATDTFIADIKQQQIKAMVGDTQGIGAASAYGFHIDTNKYVLFRGTTYSALDPSNFQVNLPSNMQFVNTGWDIVFSTMSGQIEPANTGLAGYWKFDEGTGLIANDSSGNGNSGTLSGPLWTTGKINGALSFDGINDVVTLGNPPALNMIDKVSLSLWIKPNVQFNSSSGNIQIFKKNSAYEFAYNVCALGALTFSVSNTCGGPTGAHYFSNLEASTWYHIAGTFGGTTARIYVNGIEIASTSDSGVGGGGDVCIGASCAGTRYTNAVIDDVRVYNRTLSPLEVIYLYNNGIPIKLQDATTSNTMTIQLNKYGAVTGVN